MDLALGDNFYDSFRTYQGRVIAQLDRLSDRYGFVPIDASRGPEEIFADLKAAITANSRLSEVRS